MCRAQPGVWASSLEEEWREVPAGPQHLLIVRTLKVRADPLASVRRRAGRVAVVEVMVMVMVAGREGTHLTTWSLRRTEFSF